MDFTLTGTTPEEKLKELTDKLEQGVREISPVGATQNIWLSCPSFIHTAMEMSCSSSCRTRPQPMWPGFRHGRRTLNARSKLASMG